MSKIDVQPEDSLVFSACQRTYQGNKTTACSGVTGVDFIVHFRFPLRPDLVVGFYLLSVALAKT